MHVVCLNVAHDHILIMVERIRSLVFTLNNYTNDDVVRVRELSEQCKYGVFQREVGESGTPHLQGYLYVENAKTFSRWKSLLGDRAHIEKARGTPAQASKYCKKTETRVPGTYAVIVFLFRLLISSWCMYRNRTRRVRRVTGSRSPVRSRRDRAALHLRW